MALMELCVEYLDVLLPMEKTPTFHGLLHWALGQYIKIPRRGTVGGEKTVQQAEAREVGMRG